MEKEDLTWLDAGFVEKVLRKAENDESIKVFNITAKPATAKGDNYMSNMQRVLVEFSRGQKGHEITETRSVVVKIQLQGGGMKELIINIGGFETEISMMVETLPKINKLLAKLNAPPLTPQCLYVQNENPIHLIMEDLTTEGFRMVIDRDTDLDLDHCLLIIRNIATFHATSVALSEKDPNAVQVYKKATFNKDFNTIGAGCYNGNTKSLAEQVKNWPDLGPRIAEKLLHLSTCIFEKACEAARFNENDFNVLNHGDLKSNNAMFRYDEQRKPTDGKFVDFQFSYYGSPAVDILYFLGTIASEDIRINHRELLLREYHDSLISTMAELGCSTEAPSFENLQEILRKRIVLEVISSLTILPGMIIDRSQVITVEDMLGTDGQIENYVHLGYRPQQVLTKILMFYDRTGSLEF